MSKSSLSKIVRNFIEQAKDGSANNYAQPKAPLPTTTFAAQTKQGPSYSSALPKRTAVNTKEVPKTKKAAVGQENRHLVRTGKTAATATDHQMQIPLAPVEAKSKHISLNNSKLNPSPSRSRTVIGQMGGREDLLAMSYDRTHGDSLLQQELDPSQSVAAQIVGSPVQGPRTPLRKDYASSTLAATLEKKPQNLVGISGLAAKGSLIKISAPVEEPQRLTERRHTFEGDIVIKGDSGKEDPKEPEKPPVGPKKGSTGKRINEIMKEERGTHILGDYHSARVTARSGLGSSIGPSMHRNHDNGITSLTGLKDIPSYISGTTEALGMSTPQPAHHASKGRFPHLP